MKKRHLTSLDDIPLDQAAARFQTDGKLQVESSLEQLAEDARHVVTVGNWAASGNKFSRRYDISDAGGNAIAVVIVRCELLMHRHGRKFLFSFIVWPDLSPSVQSPRLSVRAKGAEVRPAPVKRTDIPSAVAYGIAGSATAFRVADGPVASDIADVFKSADVIDFRVFVRLPFADDDTEAYSFHLPNEGDEFFRAVEQRDIDAPAGKKRWWKHFFA